MNDQKKTKERLDVVLTSVESKPDCDLIKMLKNHPYRTAKGQVWEAVKAFYLPLAIRDNEHYSQSEIRQIVLESIYSLLKQLDFLTAEMSGSLGGSLRFPLNYQFTTPVVNSINLGDSNVEKKENIEEVDEREIVDFSNSGTVYEQQGLW